MKTTSLFVPVLAAAFVSAHGYLKTVTINGKPYSGNAPRDDTVNIPLPVDTRSIIRRVATYFPTKGATSPAITCGSNSTEAALVADAQPGDSITFEWKSNTNGPWIHNTGPMMTYMANCGSVPCDQFGLADATWFKVQEVGRIAPGSSVWAQAALMNGAVANASIPQNLAPGGYLVRHEIIALHMGNSDGGAEFFAACAQIKVGGSGTGRPTPNELVNLPGAYKDNDPGIDDPHIFDPSVSYIFPGPDVAKLDGTTTSDTSSDGTSTGGNPSTSGTSPPATTSNNPPASATASEVQRRQFSRMM